MLSCSLMACLGFLSAQQGDGADAQQHLGFVQVDVGVAVELGRNCSEEIVDDL
jgi:hypothetical protein